MLGSGQGGKAGERAFFNERERAGRQATTFSQEEVEKNWRCSTAINEKVYFKIFIFNDLLKIIKKILKIL